MKYVVCETPAAITTHLRIVTDYAPIRLSGHPGPRPHSLCGLAVAWGTKSPPSSAGCRACRDKAVKHLLS